MASAEQPLKKRKLYEPPLPSPPSTPPPPQPLQPPPPPPPPAKANDEVAPPPPPRTPPPLSHDEILRRRRNHEEIRTVYENYKTIKRCLSTAKDARPMPELEQAFLSLISASRGCSSVHRILSEFIPRYATYCPTALEAAAQVIINMHNCSVHVISRAEDTDGVSFETAKNCITGLVDICYTASLEAPSSSVIRGICSAVFINAATFFASSIEGNNIFQIIDKPSMKMQDCNEKFSELMQWVLDGDASPFLKLLELRALCLLRIFFLCPKDLLAACFELFTNHSKDGFCREAKYMLCQLSGTLNPDGKTCLLYGDGASDVADASSSYVEVETSSHGIISKRQKSDSGCFNRNEAGVSKHCLLGLVLQQNLSLKKWIFSRYKKLEKVASPEAFSQVTTAFEGIFESFTQLVNIHDELEDADDDGSDSLRFVSGQYLVPRTSDQCSPLGELSAKGSSQIHGKTCKDEMANKISGRYLKHQGSVVSHESNRHSNNGCSNGGKEQGDVSRTLSSKPKDHLGEQLLSPTLAKPSETRSSAFEHGRAAQVGIPNVNFSGGVAGDAGFGNNVAAYYPSPSSQIIWYSDGDPAAMDVFSATRQLWLGSLAPDTSEAAVKFELERFGHIDNFSFFSVKGFALAEYKSINDAIKAREYMRRYSPWGYPVRIKFIDIGLGTRGAVGGVAIGSSCHVFVGNVLNQWAKDDIMRETMNAVCRGPRLVTDITSEGALLLEFDTPEEAANVMACIRKFRRGITNAMTPAPVAGGPGNMSNTHPNYWNVPSASIANVIGNTRSTMLGSPHGKTVGSPSNRRNSAAAPFRMKPEGVPLDFMSPTAAVEQGLSMQGGQISQSNVGSSVCTDTLGIVTSKGSMPAPPEKMWMYWKSQGPTIAPPQPIQTPPYMGPVYPPPSTNSWDTQGLGQNIPRPMPSIVHSSTIPPPFLQALITPLSHIPVSGIQPYHQMVPQPIMPPSLPSMPPPQPDIPPPLPPSPPMVPPPPCSPPPPPPPPAADPPRPSIELSNVSCATSSAQIQWQGTLAKSGVHYCTVCALRVESDSCKYSISVSEPSGWPAKLDMTKRTDFRHVKAAFTNTQPSRREVCELIPSPAADCKGFRDFISYLKQRECAGVIKITASKSVWARLLFILPYSPEACSMLSIKPKASDCLIALVLPKEANSEGT